MPNVQALDVQADAAEIRRALDLLAVPGGMVEIRALKIPGRGKPYNSAGYFSDMSKAVLSAATLDKRKASGVYLVLNEINPALLARSPNQTTDYLDPTTSDNDIIRRRWLPLDLDPKRPAGVSSTEDEHCAAEDVAQKCWTWLSSLGWPAPILADSGNGAHLLYRIDLPSDEAIALMVRDAIAAVADRFSGPDVDVDRKVFNAARIWKLYGTTARKGHAMPDRPHRLARLVEVPDSVEAVPVELLRALAAMAAKPEPPVRHNDGGRGEQFTSRLDVPKWLTARSVGFKVKDRPDSKGRTVFILDTCPLDNGHGGHGETAIYQAPDGKLAAACMHNGCSGKGWQEFKTAIGPPDPGHWEPPLQRNNSKATTATTATRPIAPGTRVRALDRDNFGEVTSDNGDTCTVHFVSPEGQPADVELPKTQLCDTDGRPLAKPEKAIDFGLIPAGEMLRRDYTVQWLIPYFMAACQHMLWGGPLKACKSLTAIDAAVTLALGGRFLGHFPVTRPTKTMFLSGESGWPVLQENVRRISRAAGASDLELDRNLIVGVRLPKFGDPHYMAAFEGVMKEHGPEAVFLDCAYRCVPGDNASNLFAMGELLDSVGRTFEDCKSTLILLHHSPKHIPVGDPLQLDNLAFAGFAEFSAQWALLNRQTTYTPGSGHHDLWLTVGGRAGHSGVFGLTIDEGEFEVGRDREWQVGVTPSKEVWEDKHKQREQEREARQSAKLEEVKAKILRVAARYKQGETMTRLKDEAGLKDAAFKPALAALLDAGDLVPCEIVKEGRKTPFPGYMLVTQE